MKYDSFEVAMLIKEIYSDITGIISEGLKESGLTYQQIMVIKVIAHKGKINISELCQQMHLVKGTVSGIVKRLETAGYVEKIKDDDDKRNSYVILSKEGLLFANNFRCTINQSFDKIFENFDDEEMAEIRGSLLKLKEKIIF